MYSPKAKQATKMMRAVVSRSYGAVDTIRIEDVSVPVPADNEILVRNHATVVTAAMGAVRAGASLTPRLYFGLLKPKWPVLGTNFSGKVAAVGCAVSRFAVGDRVSGANMASLGASAEYMVIPEDGVIVPTPDGLTDEETVALFDGSLTALPFLRDAAHLRAGGSILINGAAGGVGSAAVQIAKHFGAVVTAVCSTENVDLVRSLGADKVIDRTKSDFTTNLDAFDVIFDTVGKSSFAQCRPALKANGLYMTTVPSAAILVQKLWSSRFTAKKATILFTGLSTAIDITADLSQIGELARGGALAPTIGSVSSMDEAADVYALVDSGRKVGSAVIALP
ncbi:MAG: NAD(P)-dependent alcohol dehydrogenase [Kineosporiaceae bacterium]|nr:NAD(P)-dependent alcohol dehydrogenase [Aeromicrobium sp.]